MGAVHRSIDLTLIKKLKEELPLETFVETGTFEGESIKKVQYLFDKIYTVELSRKLFIQAEELLKESPNVFVYHGHCSDFLKKISSQLEGKPTLYWLDAHWCAADHTSGATDQCPLLKELTTIHPLNEDSVILIDDARFFLCPPPYPHDARQWPDLIEVIRALESLSDKHNIMVLNDIIIFYPLSIKISLTDYAQESAADWLCIMDKSRDYDNLSDLLNRISKDVREKDELIIKHHHFIQTLLEELRERGIIVSTQWK